MIITEAKVAKVAKVPEEKDLLAILISRSGQTARGSQGW